MINGNEQINKSYLGDAARKYNDDMRKYDRHIPPKKEQMRVGQYFKSNYHEFGKILAIKGNKIMSIVLTPQCDWRCQIDFPEQTGELFLECSTVITKEEFDRETANFRKAMILAGIL
jgi:hypothetical protein